MRADSAYLCVRVCVCVFMHVSRVMFSMCARVCVTAVKICICLKSPAFLLGGSGPWVDVIEVFDSFSGPRVQQQEPKGLNAIMVWLQQASRYL